MIEEKIINAFKREFYDLLGSLSIRELTQNKALPFILERISLILSSNAGGGLNARS